LSTCTLLDAGASVHVQDHNGRAALLVAQRSGRGICVQVPRGAAAEADTESLKGNQECKSASTPAASRAHAGKNRDGAIGTAKLRFEAAIQRFSDFYAGFG